MKIRYGIPAEEKTTVTIDKETHELVKEYAQKNYCSITEAVWMLLTWAIYEDRDPAVMLKVISGPRKQRQQDNARTKGNRQL